MALKSSEDTARRVARQHLSAAQNGLAQGRIAYGWVRKGERKGQLVPDEADVVVRIFQDFMSGESAYSIARSFNAEGIQPPAARTWSSTMVAKMLRNPRYAGMVSYAGKHRVQAATAGEAGGRSPRRLPHRARSPPRAGSVPLDPCPAPCGKGGPGAARRGGHLGSTERGYINGSTCGNDSRASGPDETPASTSAIRESGPGHARMAWLTRAAPQGRR
ncbi:recombinase family protein [Streptomyces lydicus]|uniref:recombinase family protein n=1 Tax=Streptomyces lydicus TaxID=47763 RepID=UPI0039A409A4